MREKVAKLQVQLNEARKAATYWEEKSTRPRVGQKEQSEMTSEVAAQKAFFASLASFARATADLLDEMAKGSSAVTAPAEVTAPAAVPPKKKTPPAAKPPETPAAAAVAPAPAAAPATNGAAPDLMTQCRTAAKSYAEVYGREGLKEILGKYTQGTLADVAAEKLPELLKELS